MAGVALGDIHLSFAWQTWYLRHWAGSGGALGRALVARGAAPLCLAGVAFGDIEIDVPFARQAWHLVTSTFTLRGRRNTCVLMYGGALGRALVARGVAPLRMAGVALGDIGVPFAWQAWHLVTSTFTLRGRRGTYGTGLALVARLGVI